jgi:hypothetical protein
MRTDTYDVRIDRKSKWGNPFVMGRDGDRAAVVAKHKVWLWSEIKAERITRADLASLDGKRLGCHCAPLACHGDTLSAAATWAKARLDAENKSA